ncbi:protein artemis-like [Lycorma delicatula]|uniref:protein artemis-like n=1 Tax=Lycorma delicatula TaxID=130591 RepID=UPI003F51085C
MLKYKGHLEGETFDFIAVDNFSSVVVDKCSAFFLSHYHTDHFIDLTNRNHAMKVGEIFKKCKEKILYCSEITKRIFLSNKNITCFIPEEQIISLPVEQTRVISNHSETGNDDSVFVSVTLIPSGHIIGAVMFLFEHEYECALFTGDFRIYPNDISKLKSLHYSDGSVKQITHLYLDTTFATDRFPTFPLRSETSSLVVQLVSEWLSSSPNHEIHLRLPYKFAYEKLMTDLSKALNCKIRVQASVYELYYKYIPELDDVVFPCNTDVNKHLNKHRIHADTCDPVKCAICCSLSLRNIRAIKPCAFSFHKNEKKKVLVFPAFDCHEMIKVPYSTHCSLEEVQAFVRYLNPKEVFTIVTHKIQHEYNEVSRNIIKCIKNLAVPSTTKSIDYTFNLSHLERLDGDDNDNVVVDSDDDNDSIPMDSPPW